MRNRNTIEYAKALSDAYWNQVEHPDLIETTCEICGEMHLNHPLSNPWCPDHMKEKTGIVWP